MAAPKGWLDKLFTRDRRRAERQVSLPLVAYYWDGGFPRSHPIRDISSTGVYLCTEQRWYPKTLVVLSLARTDAIAADADRTIQLAGRVVRSGSDGVGFEFVLPGLQQADKASLLKFLAGIEPDLSHTDHLPAPPKSL